jgi:hypothetical protein
MVEIQFTKVRIQSTINTPFRVVAFIVSIVLAAIIVTHAS